ncbi:MAG: hypothetical protein IQL11_08635 [Bacteroidales bacterium]|nr:hypothetical protein [Bacteroidales bacterium]
MEGDDEWWVLTVYISVILLMLIVTAIREHLTRRKLPKNPQDEEITRSIRKDTIYFFLHPFGGGGEKYEDDNPMKDKGKGNKYI